MSCASRGEHGRTSQAPPLTEAEPVMVARRSRLLADDVDESKHPVAEEVAAIVQPPGNAGAGVVPPSPAPPASSSERPCP